MRLNPGAILSERYEIIEKIGSGGMAVVYKAKDLKLGRAVTVKVMREEYMADEEFIKRFNVEARAAAGLSNQNIVNVYDVGQEGDVHYIVMEYVDGVTLKDLIINRAPFRNDELLGVAIQIAAGIAHAHEHQVIHRDIKPQNIMVTSQGTAKVTDFGIARAPNVATTTTSGSMMGSVHYFSPEQARGVFVDEKSDVYALGIVMYEMATGRLPFDGESSVAVALMQINDQLPPIRDYNPDVSESIVQIILKATEKSSMKRYQSANALLDDLKQAINNTGGDFVARKDGAAAPTVAVSDSDIELVKREAKNLYYDDSTDTPRRTAAPEKKPLTPAFNDDDDADDDYDDDDYDDYEEDDEDDAPFGNMFKRGKKKADTRTAGERRLERNIVIAAICTAVTIIVILTACGLYLYNKNQPKIIHPPELVGMKLSDARGKVEAAGLILTVTEEIESDEIEAGTVMSQNEPATADMRSGDAIHITVSAGTNKVKVPDVINKSIEDTQDIIHGQGFALAEDYDFNDAKPQDVCFSQTPAAGELVEPGSTVAVVYSLGPKPKSISVPNLTDMDEAEAITLLQGMGLVIGRHTTDYSATVREGKICGQTIAQGTIVSPGSEISYTLSQGPPPNTPTPEPTVEPSPSDEPTVSETPDATPDNTTVTEAPPDTTPRIKTVIINLNLPEDHPNAYVQVFKDAAAGSILIFDRQISADDLPLVIDVSGTGVEQIMTYVALTADEEYGLANIQTIDFDAQ